MNPNLTVYHLAAEIDAGARWAASTRTAPPATRTTRRSEQRSTVPGLAARLIALFDAPRRRNAGRETVLGAASPGA